MIHLREADNVYLDESLAGFTGQLAKDGIVERQVDLLLIGAAYAIQHQLRPLEKIQRHDLIRVASLDPDTRLALEASLAWYARELQLSPLETPKNVLDLLGRAGSAGLSVLKKEWESLSASQLRLKLLRLASSRTENRQDS